MRSIAIAAVPLALVAGCGGHYATSRPDGAPRGVEAAVLPYAIVDGRTGKAVDEDQFWAALDAARVVCVGEEHPNPHHHWVQLQVVELARLLVEGAGVLHQEVARLAEGSLVFDGGAAAVYGRQRRAGRPSLHWTKAELQPQLCASAAFRKGGRLEDGSVNARSRSHRCCRRLKTAEARSCVQRKTRRNGTALEAANRASC